MENKASYSMVEILIVLLSIEITVFALWLENYDAKEDIRYYKIYMSESVSGLVRNGKGGITTLNCASISVALNLIRRLSLMPLT